MQITVSVHKLNPRASVKREANLSALQSAQTTALRLASPRIASRFKHFSPGAAGMVFLFPG